MRPITVTTSDATMADTESSWVFFDSYAFAPISVQVSVSGDATYTVYTTLDDPNSPTNPVPVESMTWVKSSDINLVDATDSVQGYFTAVPAYAKVVQTDGDGSCTATFIQPAAVPL